MKKKTLAALLAALMALMLVLSACAKSDADDDDADADESAPPKTEEKAETDTEKESEDKSDKKDAAVRSCFTEQRWYGEDGELFETDLYDEDMHMIGFINYYGEDEVYYAEMRITDACEDIDTAEVEDIDGVVEVEVRECFFSESEDGPFESEDGFYVLGYNTRGEIVGMQYVTLEEGELVVCFTSVYSTDADGNETGMKRMAGSGELLFERTDENTFDDDGNIVTKISHCKSYGYVYFQDGEYVLEAFDEPVEETRTAEFGY